MRLLLDTHVVLWTLAGSRAIDRRARTAIEDASELLISVVSFAEVGVKVAVGKLTAPADLHDRVLASGIRVLGLAPDHGLAVAHLPLHHRDPFDRLLIAQAQVEQLTIVSANEHFAAYDVPLISAA